MRCIFHKNLKFYPVLQLCHFLHILLVPMYPEELCQNIYILEYIGLTKTLNFQTDLLQEQILSKCYKNVIICTLRLQNQNWSCHHTLIPNLFIPSKFHPWLSIILQDIAFFQNQRKIKCPILLISYEHVLNLLLKDEMIQIDT